MNKLLQKSHEIWLETLMAAFMSHGQNRDRLYDFASILFRHFKWIENCLIENGVEYNYNRGEIPIKVEKLSQILDAIIKDTREIDSMLGDCPDVSIVTRVKSDLEYISKSLSLMKDEEITAFDTNRKLDDIELTPEATDALTIFLFEESYKEYELIMIYNYLQAHSSDAYLNRIFQILIDESVFHLKSFGQMMSEMGILGVPRVIHPSVYQIEDVSDFLRDGIDEEIAAKEMCRELSDAVAKDSPELASFFEFINMQEDYHISLMRDALEYYAKEQQ